jgi:hypothetical protein
VAVNVRKKIWFRQRMIPKSLSSDLIRGWEPVFGSDHAPLGFRDVNSGSPVMRWLGNAAVRD